MFDAPGFASFVTGLTLSGSLIVAIGAQNTFVLRQGIRREHVGAVVALCAALDATLMAAGVGGLGSLVTERPGLLQAATMGGALVLAAYGFAAFRRALQPHALHANATGSAQPLRRVLMQALSLSLLNPHVYLDTVVLVGAVGARQPAGTQAEFLFGAALASCLWFVALGYGARTLAPLFARAVAWRALDLLVGVTMWSIAITLMRGVLGR